MDRNSDYFPCRSVRAVWDGLVALGLLHTLVDPEPYGAVSRTAAHEDPRQHPVANGATAPL